MEYIGDVFYEYGGGLYANLTNKCPCRCEFCIRDMVGALGDADSLWLRREPTLDEIKELLREWDLNQFYELVFCGYGEPTERLSDLINKRDTTEDLRGIIDAVSVSLNAKGPEEYLALCHPRFGIQAFDAIIDYTRRVKEVVPDVTMSIVGGTIPRQDEGPCRKIAESLGVKFRIR